MKFLELEGAYLVIGAFILIVTAYVSTRPFVGKNSFKIAVPIVFIILSLCIAGHYYVTTDRMKTVETRFLDNKPIICENRTQRKVAQSIILTQELGWTLENNLFSNPQFNRTFHSARCLEHFSKEVPYED